MSIPKLQEVIIYSDNNGKQPFVKWLDSLDSSIRGRIQQRILRLSIGNFGDFKFLDEGVYELRLDFGSGYRVYFGKDGDTIVVLISGGDKGTQNKDIKVAKKYWQDYLESKND